MRCEMASAAREKPKNPARANRGNGTAGQGQPEGSSAAFVFILLLKQKVISDSSRLAAETCVSSFPNA